jgi:hypothetical protein
MAEAFWQYAIPLCVQIAPTVSLCDALFMKMAKIPPDLQLWIDARRRHKLSHAQVLMARELGMNPRKLGKLDNHKQELWKLPLPQFIEKLYLKNFGRTAPEVVVSIEERAKQIAQKKVARKAAKAARRQAGESPGEIPQPNNT